MVDHGYTLVIVQALADAGLEASDDKRNWWVGLAMASWFTARAGHPPDFKYHVKTNGGGRHFMAHYPDTPEIRAQILSLARKYEIDDARQGDLFRGWKTDPDTPSPA